MRIRLRDKEFAHVHNFNGYDTSVHIQWDRNVADSPNEITVFTDQMLHEAVGSKSRVKIALTVEPPAIHPDPYNFLLGGGFAVFDYVLTHQKSLLDAIPNGVMMPGSGSWCVENEWQIYPKSKNVSILASNKKMTDGHMLRHQVIEKYKSDIDFICGHGYNSVSNKIIALRDFRYTIVIENCKADYWFTEKIIDAFATGTIPIYWGCPSIGEFFDRDGIIGFDNMNNLGTILDYIGEDHYNSKMVHIKKNFNIAKSKYKIIEDYIYQNLFKDL